MKIVKKGMTRRRKGRKIKKNKNKKNSIF